ncbi:MAG: hypothetical protein GY787_19230 [Alteromonadales bacterium]|nr:hypothetical protein [Alteromonadales bacterium]
MIHFHLLVIVLRVTAIILILRILETLPMHMETISLPNDMISANYLWFAFLIPTAIQLAFAFFFWFFPKLVIKTIIPNTDLDLSQPNHFKNLSSALTVAIGVYMISFSIADLVYHLALKSEISNNFGSTLAPHDIAAFYATIAELVIGSQSGTSTDFIF